MVCFITRYHFLILVVLAKGTKPIIHHEKWESSYWAHPPMPAGKKSVPHSPARTFVSPFISTFRSPVITRWVFRLARSLYTLWTARLAAAPTHGHLFIRAARERRASRRQAGCAVWSVRARGWFGDYEVFVVSRALVNNYYTCTVFFLSSTPGFAWEWQ